MHELMTQVPLTIQCLDTRGLYLLNNGLSFIVWLGRMLPPDLITGILGANLANFPDLSKVFYCRFNFSSLLNNGFELYCKAYIS